MMAKVKLSIRPILDATKRCIFATARFVRRSIPRAYGVGMLFLICWLTFLSIRYLVRSLVSPSSAPAQIVGIPTRLEPEILSTERSAWKAIGAAETPRIPAAHYHRIDSWIEPDRFNDCTRSGCHSALPHSRRKEVRAFLNMHATSIHCGVCHMKTETEPLHLTWYDLETGRSQEPPAILHLYDRLTSRTDSNEVNEIDKNSQQELVRLMKLAAHDAGDSKSLNQLARHFGAVRPGSPAFMRLMEEAKIALPRYFRGEYGAKIALLSDDGQPLLSHPNTAKGVQSFLQSGEKWSDGEREKILERIHPLRRETPLKCSACHVADDSLIPFERLGYPNPRIRSLIDPVIFQMIEHIDSGQSFEMPRFLTPKNSR